MSLLRQVEVPVLGVLAYVVGIVVGISVLHDVVSLPLGLLAALILGRLGYVSGRAARSGSSGDTP